MIEWLNTWHVIQGDQQLDNGLIQFLELDVCALKIINGKKYFIIHVHVQIPLKLHPLEADKIPFEVVKTLTILYIYKYK